MDAETEIAIARMAAQISAQKLIIAAILGRYAREFGADADDFIMTITAPLSGTTTDDAGDPASKVAALAFAQMAQDIEELALARAEL